ncbi:MAG: AAA family ATPase [Oscillospiraceae bacterium]
MRVSRIALSGFRNYEWESFTFDPGTNVIRGKNGQGKTNLLEAVFMLTGGRASAPGLTAR